MLLVKLKIIVLLGLNKELNNDLINGINGELINNMNNHEIGSRDKQLDNDVRIELRNMTPPAARQVWCFTIFSNICTDVKMLCL